jgi:hypothetical protein
MLVMHTNFSEQFLSRCSSSEWREAVYEGWRVVGGAGRHYVVR